MSDKQNNQTADMMDSVAKITEQSQRLVKDFYDRQSQKIGKTDTVDYSAKMKKHSEISASFFANPAKLMELQLNYWKDWMSMAGQSFGLNNNKAAAAPVKDKRFKDKEWQENPLFSFIKDSYLLTSGYMMDAVKQGEGLDDKTASQVEFYTKQFVDALSPTNFAALNPAVIRKTQESGGQNLLDGLSNLLSDLEQGEGQLRISMTDTDAFELGENVGTTKGKVIYQNDLMQLIQYSPTSETVNSRPMLFVPPWINKYYILDLQPVNSLVKYTVDQGNTLFLISWINPDETLRDKSFEDYMQEGILSALDAIEKETGVTEVNALGFCLGGTLLATTLAYMASIEDRRIKSATLMATLVDFEKPGDLGVFIDEEQLKTLDEKMDKQGFLDGKQMATSFNMLRANDLIWSFVVNNYLMGNEPMQFDLLYWNSDSTRLPAAMHSYYLRNMYLENNLCKPNGIQMKGVDIDLRKIDIPVYMVATQQDHITLWDSTYAGTQLYQGDTRFVLGGSGHIAGIINPPTKDKYGYHTNDELPADPQQWLEGATQNSGSWWPDWTNWLGDKGGDKVEARQPGANTQVLEDAPGSYVKVRY
jgi:polyhydroxyalkanoate synthase